MQCARRVVSDACPPRRRHPRAALAAAAVALAILHPADAARPPNAAADEAFRRFAAAAAGDGQRRLCALIERAAAANGMPAGFFTRLLWKESRFRADALSPKGAQGIAQFMPGTAAERGLLDPFDVAAALPASAGLLADLRDRFGNLGLAAAAYNAGAGRVANFVAGRSGLPFETVDYVEAITGRQAEAWKASGRGGALMDPVDANQDCLTLAAALRMPGQDLGPPVATERGPWGVQVAGFFSRTRAIDAYLALQRRYPGVMGSRPPMVVGQRLAGRGPRVFYRVRVPAPSRGAADTLCTGLRRQGQPCIVLKT